MERKCSYAQLEINQQTNDTLNKYGQDLVDRARKQKLDPVIGRDEEIRNIIRILSRKTKNNPVLIGEPGVGKTAIINNLAHRIGNPQLTPPLLRGYNIYQLDFLEMSKDTNGQGVSYPVCNDEASCIACTFCATMCPDCVIEIEEA